MMVVGVHVSKGRVMQSATSFIACPKKEKMQPKRVIYVRDLLGCKLRKFRKF